MAYTYGKNTFTNDETEELLSAIEMKLRDGVRESVSKYSTDLDGLHVRVKELEQSQHGFPGSGSGFVPGFGGGQETKANPISRAFESESLRGVFEKQSKTGKTTIDAGALLTKNTILGESGSPQAPDGIITQADRAGVVAGAFRSLSLLDFVPKVNVTSNMVEWPAESAWSNNAAEAPEGSTKADSDLTFSLESANIATIAHTITLSRQVWDDAPWLRTYAGDRLEHGVRAKLQARMVNGTGIAPEIKGITASGAHTAFSPSTGESALDSLSRARYAVMEADREPDFIVMRPGDFGAIERERRATGDAGLVLGDGNAAAYVSGGLPTRLWGLNVILSNDLTAGKFILGASDAMRLFVRQDATLEVFDSHSNYAQLNLLLLRAELRAAFAVMVPSAIQYGDLVA